MILVVIISFKLVGLLKLEGDVKNKLLGSLFVTSPEVTTRQLKWGRKKEVWVSLRDLLIICSVVQAPTNCLSLFKHNCRELSSFIV